MRLWPEPKSKSPTPNWLSHPDAPLLLFFISCLFIKRNYSITQYSCFIVQEHRPWTSEVTNFNGTQPKGILYIPRSLCSQKDTSLLHPLKIFHGIIISLEICICHLSWFSHSKLIESCKPQGCSKCSNNMKLPMLGQKVLHLRLHQSTGSHGLFSSAPSSNPMSLLTSTENYCILKCWLYCSTVFSENKGKSYIYI